MTPTDLKYWIALKFVDGVGNVAFKDLVKAFGSPRAVFEASMAELQKVPRISHKKAHSIYAFDDWDRVEREMERAQRLNVSLVTAASPIYPSLLLNIYDFPPILYVKGSLLPDDIMVAVVGSRMASTYGRFTTERLCRELAMGGITVVSGMARGIDSAAHAGALAGKGRTIAVLGCGIDIVYPPENNKLFEKIAEHGAVITEFPFSTQPVAPNFPARNRIISGLSLGVLVVEAGEKSGSLITARIALEQNREVFAVPGNIDSPGTKGTHSLIRDGAKLVENAGDILEEIIPQLSPMASFLESTDGGSDGRVLFRSDENPTSQEQRVLKSMGAEKVHVDTLAAQTGYKVQDLLAILMSLELKGYVAQQPGKIFVAKE